jgi:ribosomal protein L29
MARIIVKVNKFKKEIALLSVVDLRERLDQMRKELFSLRINSSVTHIKDYSHFAKLRGNIARVLTALSQKEKTMSNS